MLTVNAITVRLNAKPYVRWWWLSGPFHARDIVRQLRWIKENGFGGVELAWIDPVWLPETARAGSRPDFLSEEWTQLVLFAKQEAGKLDLDCDFTFGSSWPFGGSWITPEHAAQTFNGPSQQRLGASWESAERNALRIVDHLSGDALREYAEPLLRALAPTLAGRTSALFCDSLEIETEKLWSPALWDEFEARFGYRLEPFAETLQRRSAIRYDYRKLLGEVIRREFYQAFTEINHRAGALSRVQCHGAPTDLLAAYASVDIPESEALLFLPPFSHIAASAAAWSGQPVVSAEAFTCLYGFRGWDDSAAALWKQESAGDLKLLGDALFAHGVNQLVWHGMPYRTFGGAEEFYAAVHVGPDSPFANSLPSLNAYFADVCSAQRAGVPYASLGIYLPCEDALMQNRIPAAERTPGANYRWELRDVCPASETRGFAPVWVSLPFLQQAEFDGRKIRSRSLALDALYVDCEWLDGESLFELQRLQAAGGPITWKRRPRQPGRRKHPQYQKVASSLVGAETPLSALRPLLLGESIPPYWGRQIGEDLQIFFAHPLAEEIGYPMPHRMSDRATPADCDLTVHWSGIQQSLPIHFGQNSSAMVRISAGGSIEQITLSTAFEPQS